VPLDSRTANFDLSHLSVLLASSAVRISDTIGTGLANASASSRSSWSDAIG